MEIIERKKKAKPDKNILRILAEIEKELTRSEKNAPTIGDPLHDAAVTSLKILQASLDFYYLKGSITDVRKGLVSGVASMVRFIKTIDDKVKETPGEHRPVTKMEKKPQVKDNEKKEVYFSCVRSGHRISENICMARVKEKKFGCTTCKKGKEIARANKKLIKAEK